MSHARTHDDWIEEDPELRESIRSIRRQRSWGLIGVVAALVAALVTATVYAYLSYNDPYETPVPGQQP
jgi:hypothetical protein